jgi:hypothetical protein
LRRRKGAILLLVLCVISLCVYYDFEHEKHVPYPSAKRIIADYSSYVGQKVMIFGSVTRILENACIIGLVGMEINVGELPAKVGDRVEVLGTLLENQKVEVEKFLVYEEFNYYSIFLRSFLGLFLFAFLFFKAWKFKEWGFVERKHA